jgi:hypothetical protein
VWARPPGGACVPGIRAKPGRCNRWMPQQELIAADGAAGTHTVQSTPVRAGCPAPRRGIPGAPPMAIGVGDGPGLVERGPATRAEVGHVALTDTTRLAEHEALGGTGSWDPITCWNRRKSANSWSGERVRPRINPLLTRSAAVPCTLNVPLYWRWAVFALVGPTAGGAGSCVSLRADGDVAAGGVQGLVRSSLARIHAALRGFSRHTERRHPRGAGTRGAYSPRPTRSRSLTDQTAAGASRSSSNRPWCSLSTLAPATCPRSLQQHPCY